MGLPSGSLLVGAALIVRDEERCLARCLSSLQPVVDEIVVVDTGSTDRSVEIALAHGAQVLHRPWDGDFSAARNLGLEHVRSDWVLYVDADEYLADPDVDRLRAQLASDTDNIAFRLLLRHRPGFTPLREYRLWRNRPELRFAGVIHESIVPSIDAVCESEGLRVGLLDLLVEHDGYEGDQSAKHERNLPLLEEQIRNDPTRTYLWDHVGRIQQSLGHVDEARAAFRGGVDLIRRHGSRQPVDCLVFADLIHLNAFAGEPDASLVAEALELFPGNAVVLWSAALDAFARGSSAEVERHVTALLAVTEQDLADAALGMDMSVQAEWAPHLRGLARFEMGDFTGAAEDLRMAEAAAPQELRYRVQRQLAEAKALQAAQ